MADNNLYLELCIVSAAAFLVHFLLKAYHSSTRNPLPPGPKALPVIGNVFDMPNERQWLKFTEWKDLYGDLVYLNVLGSPILIVNSANVAAELMDKKGSIYSSRPPFTMFREVIGWTWNVALQPYDKLFNTYRKVFNQQLSSRMVSKLYEQTITMEARKALVGFATSPEDWDKHLQITLGSLIMMFTYGHTVESNDDEYLKLSGDMLSALNKVTPGAFLVDTFSPLKYVPSWFPGAHFKRLAKEWEELGIGFAHKPFNMVKERMRNGSAPSCFTEELLNKEVDTAPFDKEFVVLNCAATMYIAGFETSNATICNALFLLMTHPIVQQRAQEELDAVLGGLGQRLPEFSDRKSLPYLDCILKETLRRYPVARQGVPHYSVQDDIHSGYFIPKGTTVIANAWAMGLDPSVYPEPEEFRPERHHSNFRDGKAPERDPADFVFGFGRRICPGRHLADSTAWIMIASILAVFNVFKPKDSSGKEIEQELTFSSGFVNIPQGFHCVLQPRSADAMTLLQSVDT